MKTNDALAVEMWYLAKNKSFQLEVNKIRKKFGISPYKPLFSKKLNIKQQIEQQQEFKENLHSLLARCRFAKSKRIVETYALLEKYVLTNKIEPLGYSPQPLPSHEVKLRQNKVALTFYLDSDATLTEVKTLISTPTVRNKIKEAQSKLGGSKYRNSSDFALFSMLWELRYEKMHKLEYLEDKATEYNPDKAYLKPELKRKLDQMNKRIQSSYND